MEKKFNPQPGDKILCNNGDEYTCCTLEFLRENIASGINSTKPIFGAKINNGGYQDWYTTGIASSDLGDDYDGFDIREVIPKQKEETTPPKTEVEQLTFTPEDIRKAFIDDLGWLEVSLEMLMESLEKVKNPEYMEYLRLKAMFEPEEE